MTAAALARTARCAALAAACLLAACGGGGGDGSGTGGPASSDDPSGPDLGLVVSRATVDADDGPAHSRVEVVDTSTGEVGWLAREPVDVVALQPFRLDTVLTLDWTIIEGTVDGFLKATMRVFDGDFGPRDERLLDYHEFDEDGVFLSPDASAFLNRTWNQLQIWTIGGVPVDVVDLDADYGVRTHTAWDRSGRVVLR